MRPRLDRSRGAFRAAVFLLCFTLVLFAANLLFTAREVNATRAAEASTVQLCQAGNTARAQQAGLWEYILGLSRQPRTPQQQAVVARFERHLHAVFAQRNCMAFTR